MDNIPSLAHPTDRVMAFPRLSRANVHTNGNTAALYHDSDLDAPAMAMPDGSTAPVAPGIYSGATGTDDATALNARYTGLPVSVHVAPQPSTTFDANDPVHPPSNSRTVFHPSMHIVPSFAGADVAHCPVSVYTPYMGDGTQFTTLSSNVVVDSDQIVTALALSPNDEIEIRRVVGGVSIGGDAQCFTVDSVVGTTAKLDKSVRRAFRAGDFVFKHPVRYKNVHLDGGDATIEWREGMGAILNAVRSSHILFENFRLIMPRASVPVYKPEGLTFDIGCDNCTARRIWSDGLELCACGTDNVLFEDCHAYNVKQSTSAAGFVMMGCTGAVTIRNCSVSNSTKGIVTYGASGPASTAEYQTDHLVVEGGYFCGFDHNAVVIDANSHGLIEILGSKLGNSTLSLVHIEAGSAAHLVFDGIAQNTANTVFKLDGGTADIRGVVETLEGANAYCVQVLAGAKANVTAQLRQESDGYGVIVSGANALAVFHDTRFVLTKAGTAMFVAMTGALLVLDRLDTVATGKNVGVTTIGLMALSGACVRIGNKVDLSSCDTPIYVNGATLSRGTITMTGATPQAVAFTDAKAGDILVIPGAAQYTVVVTPGTGFTVTGTAGDTGTYPYYVQ